MKAYSTNCFSRGKIVPRVISLFIPFVIYMAAGLNVEVNVDVYSLKSS